MLTNWWISKRVMTIAQEGSVTKVGYLVMLNFFHPILKIIVLQLIKRAG